MAHEDAQSLERSTRERDDSQTDHECPACGKAVAGKRRTKVAITTAHKFPQEHMVLEAVTCERCGCVTLYDPSAIQRDVSRALQS